MKNRFDLLVFDWDGTLFNSIDWIVESIQESAKACSFNVPSSKMARSIIGLNLDEAMHQLFPDISSQEKRDLVQAYKQHYTSRNMDVNDLFQGVLPMLSQLRQAGYMLAVATGKGRKGLQSVLNATGTTACFNATRCADEAESKPHPKMLFQLIDEMEVTRSRVLMIGDSVHDLVMANNAGVDSVAVSCGASDPMELQQFKPLLCLPETRKLAEILL
ncbi:MAG: HAD-IA family hydrolase [Methylococcales bacterium]